MKIYLLQDWTGYDVKDKAVKNFKAGQIASVYHSAGTKLIHRRLGKWVCREEGDPDWAPAEPLRYKAAQPQHDRMMREGLNR